MEPGDVAHLRMRSTGLTSAPFGSPEDVVRWFGAAQAQLESQARGSIGQRLGPRAVEADVRTACDEGRILRTHVLRTTWHFVVPEDLRWLQALTGPRVIAGMATAFRRSDLTAEVLLRSHSLIHAALSGETSGERSLTRSELAVVLADGGIEVSGNPLAYVMMHAELEALICSGPQRGNQPTYALVDERVPVAPAIDRDEAVVELVLRFFTSHGPATLKDLRWWSSLTLADLRRGIEGAGDRLQHDVVDGTSYWSGPARESRAAPSYRYLQLFDEYLVAFTESKPAFDLSGRYLAQTDEGLRRIGVVIRDGQAAGHYRRTVRGGRLVLETMVYDEPDRDALQVAADELGAFVGLEAVVEASVI